MYILRNKIKIGITVIQAFFFKSWLTSFLHLSTDILILGNELRGFEVRKPPFLILYTRLQTLLTLKINIFGISAHLQIIESCNNEGTVPKCSI